VTLEVQSLCLYSECLCVSSPLRFCPWVGAFNIEVSYYATNLGCKDLSIACANIIYIRTLSSLEENLKMTSRGRNM